MMLALFQSPSLRGSGRFLAGSVWSVILFDGFNPLHCGAVVASFLWPAYRLRGGTVSIPFIAGQWSLLLSVVVLTWPIFLFQSPSLRGSGRF